MRIVIICKMTPISVRLNLKNFILISCAVLELLRKVSQGGRNPPPPGEIGLIIVNSSIRNEVDEQSYYQEDNSNTETLEVNDRMNRSEGEIHPSEQEQLDATNVTESRRYPRRIIKNRDMMILSVGIKLTLMDDFKDLPLG